MSFTVQEVAQLLKQAKENEKPYVFFTGAGCSISAGVPSATGLIEEIRSRYPIQVKNIDHAKDQYNYGKYMSVLDKDERRRLLKPHILDNKNINWAHIALACLMQDKYIERVLTFNFDSILSRACNLLGLYPSIYDFATANPHLYHLINDPSIVHLHGQGTGFVQLNTKEETQKHTEHLGDFIAATLNSNPSLFIGYSGNADEFFPLLKEKYSEQHRLIWTGRKESIDDIEANSIKDFLRENSNLTHYIGNTDADHFLIQLAKELDCFPPELFSNPYKFLNQQLENVQEYPLGDGLDILANLTEYLKEQSTKPLTKSLYTAFIHKYPSKDSTNSLSEKSINEIMWAYDQQATSLFTQEKFLESFKLYEQALSILPIHFGCLCNYSMRLAIYGESRKDIPSLQKALNYHEKSIQVQTKSIIALTNYAHTLYHLGKITKDNSYFSKSVEFYESLLKLESNNIKILQGYAGVLFEWASLDSKKELFEQTLLIYKQVLDIHSNDSTTLVNYANTLCRIIQIEESLDKNNVCFDYYEKALILDPENSFTLESYSTALLSVKNYEKYEELSQKAEDILKKLEIYKPKRTYNLACHYSRTNQPKLAKEHLLKAEKHNTLPKNTFKHLSEDTDLNNIRNEPWFIELLDRLNSKDEKENLGV